MDGFFEYKDYYGSAEVHIADDCLSGEILYIQDVVTYEAQSLPELRKEFEKAVDDYLATCKSLGQKPEAVFRGSLNINIGEKLHRATATQARLNNVSVDEYVADALKTAIDGKDIQKRYHNEVILMMLFIGLLMVLFNAGLL